MLKIFGSKIIERHKPKSFAFCPPYIFSFKSSFSFFGLAVTTETKNFTEKKSKFTDHYTLSKVILLKPIFPAKCLAFVQVQIQFGYKSYCLNMWLHRKYLKARFLLTHYSPVLLFYTPWKHQKVFWCFRGVQKSNTGL